MQISYVSLISMIGVLVATFLVGLGCGIVFVRRANRNRRLRIDEFHSAGLAASDSEDSEDGRSLRLGSPRRLPHVVG